MDHGRKLCERSVSQSPLCLSIHCSCSGVDVWWPVVSPGPHPQESSVSNRFRRFPPYKLTPDLCLFRLLPTSPVCLSTSYVSCLAPCFYICKHTHAHTNTRTHTHEHAHTYTYTHVHKDTRTHTYTYTRTDLHTYLCAHVDMYVHT